MRSSSAAVKLRRRLLPCAALITLIGASTGALYAQLQKAQQTAGSGGKTYPVDFDAALFKYDDPTNTMTATEQVTIVSQGSTLHTDVAIYNRGTGVATSPGALQVDDAQNTLTGDRGVAYYNTRDVEINGNVKIIVRPKPDDQKSPKSSARREFKDPVTVLCDRVRYNWRTRKAILTGHLTLKQKDRTITGDRGLYDGNTETIELIGNLKSRRPNGERMDTPGDAARAVAVVREGSETLSVYSDKTAKGRISATVPVQDEDDKNGSDKGTVAPAKPIIIGKSSPTPTAPEEHPSPSVPAPAPPPTTPSPSPDPVTPPPPTEGNP